MNQTFVQVTLLAVVILFEHTMGLTNDYEVDVRCTKKGINVRLAFIESFNGIIFSKGFYNDQQCRYAENGPGFKIVAFNIPFSSCGTEIELGSLNNISNIIAIQHNPLLETWKDSEVTLSCQSIFPSHNMSETGEVDELDSSSTMVWMELKLGEKDIAANSVAYIGEKLSVIIHVKDGGTVNDISVSNCKAQSNLNISSEIKFIRLLDDSGCSTSEKLLSSFNISTSPDGNFIASSFLNAFRFTDQDDLYLSCNIELCRDVCHKFCSHSQNARNADTSFSRRSRSFTEFEDSHIFDYHENEDKDLTRKLMYLTMNILASRLKGRSSNMKGRLRGMARSLALDYDNHDYGDEYNAEESSTEVTTKLSETEQPNLQMTVIKKLKVLATKPMADLHTSEITSTPNEYLPNVRFIVPIVLFSFIALCLLIAILMACYIRRERKRSENNKLLYLHR